MSTSLLQELLELNEKRQLAELLSSGNIHEKAGKDVEHLTDTDEFKEIAKQDPNFANKLKLAWEGDAKDYEKLQDKKKFDPLFPQMLGAKAIEKFAPKLQLDAKKLELLKSLHINSFPKDVRVSVNPDKSNWSHVEYARESLEGFDQEAYELLKEEVRQLLEGFPRNKLVGAPEEAHIGFEDKGNFDKAVKVLKKANVPHTPVGDQNGIHYINFDSRNDANKAGKLVSQHIDKSKESEWE